MPNYSKNEIILVRYPFSDLLSSKVRPAVVVSTPHPSQDILIVPLTSRTASLLDGEFLLSDWSAAGLNVATLHESCCQCYTLDSFSPIATRNRDMIICSNRNKKLDQQIIMKLKLGKTYTQKDRLILPEDLIRKANQQKREGKLNEAITKYRRAIKLSPNSFILYQNLGDTLAQKGLLEEAVLELKKAIELNPRSALSHCYLGEVAIKQKLFDEAIFYFDRAIEIQPKCHKYYNSLGLALMEKEKYDLAINCFQKAIELKPDSCWGYYNLSQVLSKQDKLSLASSYYQKAIRLNPQLSNDSKKSNNIVSPPKDSLEMAFTGERYIPRVKGQIRYEHLHRYGLCLEIVRGKSVLDIASGEGYGSAILSKTASSVVGVDIDIESVKFAGDKYQDKSNLKFIVGQCNSIPLPNESIDVVVSFETIEHHDQHEEMMQEIQRVLKKDGILVISSPNRLVYSDLPNYQNPFHVKELYQQEFVDLLNKYFLYFTLYGQKICMGSFIYSLNDNDKYYITHYTSNDQEVLRKNCSLDDPVYFVALCSNNFNGIQYALESVYLDKNDSLERASSETSSYTITATIISCSQDDPEALWGFNLDGVQQTNTSNSNGIKLMLLGWVLGKKSKVEAIEIIYNHVVVKQVLIDFPRPDVAQVYSHLPDAEMSGFETIVDIGELVEEGELLIQAVCSNKSCIPLKKVQFQVVAAEKQ
ncbi:tetratricopeptide repeat protein [Planktothrix agardhii]|uniref:S-adenosylmethionine-dependent methyltransferase MSMEG_2350/MSMEI_2290 n=1 Tax=Planktothrix agardhii TaxID=1160 RepID=A0AAD1Q215_PLAAG|nr:tetratricopeptide repeat protein [Planktothrix agardhii]CAD5937982.1 putative S-adenosylmethionine-dependent methyltransferase MSMEG_2350/MSMEI_2290 [Planktothrix agardhii]